MKVYKTLFLAGLMMLATSQAFAWGQLGHYLIGYMAERQMKKSTLKKVEKVLYPMSLGRSGTWMDEIRSDRNYDYATTWHYLTSKEGEYNPEIQESTGDAFEAIQRLKAELIAGGLSPKEESEKLKMLIHMVEDIHQPLHVGTGEDRGGNDVKIEFFGRPTNLHALWDSGMIERQGMSYSEIGDELFRRITPELQDSYREATMEDWLKEAVSLRPAVYDLPEDRRLSYLYMYQNFHIAEERMIAASVRLAQILDEIYG
ncbi:MAG: S1/P1 nuclease [Cyclobacteriaceae bacterium]|uniref:S1/P1 nuclease n=1 Tax=Algoriphagus marincola TaxID=264027 RepID=A0ABS7N5Y6_9BACT|nr:S1/P1 nuclease [Algoriphagus marincola]MBY5951718.1 S1/P1 nuclease [Algoriphagus marincola]MCR9081874.1 S1/P1 nuclease [Cyclobacteriaceae bacterium]